MSPGGQVCWHLAYQEIAERQAHLCRLKVAKSLCSGWSTAKQNGKQAATTGTRLSHCDMQLVLLADTRGTTGAHAMMKA